MTGILIGLIIAVSLIVLVQLLRVNELISQVKNEDPNLVKDQDNQTQCVILHCLLLSRSLFMLPLLTTSILTLSWSAKTWVTRRLPPTLKIYSPWISVTMKTNM